MFCFCVLAPKEYSTDVDGGEVNRCAGVCACVLGGASLSLREVAARVKPLSADSNDTGASTPNPMQKNARSCVSASTFI